MGKLTFGATGLSYQPKDVKVNTFGAPNCPRCSERVFFNEERRAVGKVWHTRCFTCVKCQKRLDTSNVSGHEGEIYCGACHKKDFGPKGYGFAGGAAGLQTESKPRRSQQTTEGPKTMVPASIIPATVVDPNDRDNCLKCGKKVFFAEEVKALKRKFHRLCFKCGSCNKMLEPGRCSEHVGDVYCTACYGRNFGPKGYGWGGGASNLLSSDMSLQERRSKRRLSATDKFDANGRLIEGFVEPVGGEISPDNGYASPENGPGSPASQGSSGPRSPVSKTPADVNEKPSYQDSIQSRIYRAKPIAVHTTNAVEHIDNIEVRSATLERNKKVYPAVNPVRRAAWADDRASPVDHLMNTMNKTHLDDNKYDREAVSSYTPPPAAVRDISDRAYATATKAYQPATETQSPYHPNSAEIPQHGYQPQRDGFSPYQPKREGPIPYQPTRGGSYQTPGEHDKVNAPAFVHVREASSGYESSDHLARDGSPDSLSPGYGSQTRSYSYPNQNEYMNQYRNEQDNQESKTNQTDDAYSRSGYMQKQAAENPNYRQIPINSPGERQNSPYRSGEPESQEYRPSETQSQAYRPSEPQSQTYRPSEPQSPTYRPSEPQSPTYRPSEPQSPTYRPSEPQSPAYRPNEPQSPTYRPSEPQSPAYRPNEPQSQAYRPNEPQSQAYRPSEPQSPTYRPSQAGNPLYRPSPTSSPMYKTNTTSGPMYGQGAAPNQLNPAYRDNEYNSYPYNDQEIYSVADMNSYPPSVPSPPRDPSYTQSSSGYSSPAFQASPRSSQVYFRDTPSPNTKAYVYREPNRNSISSLNGSQHEGSSGNMKSNGMSPLNTQAAAQTHTDVAKAGLSSPVSALFSHMGTSPFSNYSSTSQNESTQYSGQQQHLQQTQQFPHQQQQQSPQQQQQQQQPRPVGSGYKDSVYV